MKRSISRRQAMGRTIPEFAETYDVPESQVRRGADRGEIKTVLFAGLRRITPAEERRLCDLFGLIPVGGVDNEHDAANNENAST